MKIGDEVLFLWNGRYYTGKIIGRYPEYHDAVKVQGVDKAEYTLTPAEITTKARVQAQKEADKKEEYRLKYSDVIDAWGKGYKTPKTMALHIDGNPRGVANRIAAAKRMGFIQ